MKTHSRWTRLMRCHSLIPAALMALGFLSSAARAATKTWDGSTSGNWTTPANWSGGTAPVNGDSLVFPTGVTRLTMTNNFNPPRSFRDVLFTGANYTLRGTNLFLTDGISGENSSAANAIECIVELQADQQFMVSGQSASLQLRAGLRLNGHTLSTASNGEIDISGVISGTGNIIKRDLHTLVFSGTQANTYNGVTTVSDGILRLDKNASVRAVPGDLVVNRGRVDMFNDEQIADSSDVTIASGTLLDFGGFTDTIGSLSGNGQLNLGSGGALYVGGNNASTVVGGSITGSGAVFEKKGTGTLTLTGASTYTGLSSVTEGTLILNGTHPQFLVTSTGILGGTGTVAGVTARGQVRPGVGGPGRLTVSGPLIFNSSGSLDLELNGTLPGSGFDQILVTKGSVDLGSATLNVRPAANASFVIGTTFRIIDMAISFTLSGTFNGLPNGSQFTAGQFVFRINYGSIGNDVTLTVIGIIPTGVARRYVGPTFGNSSWSLAQNWSPSGHPNQGDSLEFLAVEDPQVDAPNTNDLPVGMTFDQIRLVDAVNSFHSEDGTRTLRGNLVRLINGIRAVNDPLRADGGALNIELPLALVADQTFTNGLFFSTTPFGKMSLGDIELDGHTLTFGNRSANSIIVKGIISGTGAASRIIKASPADLTISGNHTYGGATLLNAGKLILRGQFASPVVASAGTTLDATGAIGGLTLTGAAMEIGTGAAGGTLQATGAVTFDTASRWDVRLQNLNSAFDQLVCNSSVNLGGATLSLLNPPLGDADYMILNKTSAGAISGTFAGLPQGAEFLVNNRFFRISYVGGNGNDVVITSTNKPPVFAPVQNQTIFEQLPFTVTISASGPETGERLAYTLDAGSPAGATIGPNNGVLLWTPTDAQGPGVYTLIVRATDDGNPIKSSTLTFQVTVLETNFPPVVTAPATVTGDELTQISFTISGSDPDSPPANLTYQLLQGPLGMTLTSASSASAIATWIPTEEQGPLTSVVLVRVSESVGGLSTTQSITVIARERNVTPMLQPIASTNVFPGTLIERALVASDTDLPANPLSLELLPPVPAGASIMPGPLFRWTPASDQLGLFTFKVRCFDNNPPAVNATSLSVTQEFTVAVQTLRTVINTNDSGAGSLRQAILDVNANSGGGQIRFDIPGTGPHKIAPSTPLPVLTRPTIMNGYTQTGSKTNALANGNDAILMIELSGETIPNAIGLGLNGSNITVRGLCLNRWSTAIATCPSCSLIVGSSNVVVEGCFIGSDRSGMVARPNTNGIAFAKALGGRIGGPAPAQRNLISGNEQAGISLVGTALDPLLHNLVIQGNFIGTDRTGTNGLGNGSFGILSETNGPTTNALIADNIISANGLGGVRLAGTGNSVLRNKIGLGADGLTPLGNNGPGVELFGNRHQVGGANGADANLIAHNNGPGVWVNTGVAHAVLGNSFFRNTGLAIDLDEIGPRANDPLDGDSGANNLQNTPIVTNAATFGARDVVVVSGTLNSRANSAYRIEVFHSPDFAPNSQPQGRTFLGSAEITTDGSGNATFSVLSPVPSTNGFITATATDAAGSTSEISPGAGIVGGPSLQQAPPTELRLALDANNNAVLRWTPAPVNVDPIIFPGYQLQASEDLVNWFNVGLPVGGGIGANFMEQALSLPRTGPARFFRLVISLDFSNANLAGLNLSDADLSHANLTDANLTGANLSGADFTGARLGGTILDGANLTGANLDDYSGEFILHTVAGPPDEPVSMCIPDLGFNAREGDYSRNDPTLPDLDVSYNTLTLVFKQGTLLSQANTVLQGIGALIVGGVKGNPTNGPGLLILRVPTANFQELAPLLTTLRGNPLVRRVTQDSLVNVAMVPPVYFPGAAAPSWTWDLQRGNGGNWGFKSLRVPQMWNFNSAVSKAGTDAVTTGIIDGGFCQTPHPDVFFAYIPPITHPHGTFVASVIGATFGNKSGMEGVNPFARMIPRAGLIPGKEAEAEIMDRVRSLTRQGVRVINISLGCSQNPGPTPAQIDARAISMRTNGLNFADMIHSLSGQKPLICVAAGNCFGMDAALSLGAAFAGVRGLVDNVLVVEALQVTAPLDAAFNATLGQSCYSDTNGHVSAPADEVTAAAVFAGCPAPPFPPAGMCGGGCANSCLGSPINIISFGGTSIAAPFVTGLAGYCFALDPTLTAPEVATLIRRNSFFVGPGVAPRVDAWATVMDIDRLVGERQHSPSDRVLRMLLDIDDGTPDGNKRVNPDGSDFRDDLDTDGNPRDGEINMADFRRWRDWLLEAESPPGLNLDGTVFHKKKDLNGDGDNSIVFGFINGTRENIFP